MTHYLIVGAGRSALGAARLLRGEGNAVTISDIEEKFPEVLKSLRETGSEVIIGPQGPALLEGVDALVVSPGLSPKIPLLAAAREKGLPILSEIDIALARFSGTMLGVTGTNGKSTTTLLLAHFLNAAGIKAEASGNIGVAPSLLLAEGHNPQAFVLELSSYQLDYSEPLKNSVSLFMSFAPDHMERHGTMENYFRAKWKLIMAAEDLVILPRKILAFAKEYGMPWPKAPMLQILLDDEEPVLAPHSALLTIDTRKGAMRSRLFPHPMDFGMKLEVHNQLNVAAAFAACFSITRDTHVLASLKDFAWLPYRFQKIGTLAGQAVYNDSKSTNVESTEIALQSLDQPCLLLLGGAGKGESYRPLLAHRSRIRKLITFGASAPLINADLAALRPLTYPTLKAALEALPEAIAPGSGPIVFSPANASFDEFGNFEERGAFFNRVMAPLLDAQKAPSGVT